MEKVIVGGHSPDDSLNLPIIGQGTPSLHPQEIEVWYILPAIRKELVLVMKGQGLSQKKIADLLNVSEAAVSQYGTSKRAKKISFNDEVKDFIRNSASLIEDKISAYQQIQKISGFIKNSKAICEIHMQLEKDLDGCGVCYKD
jgi:uncharacterized protein